MEQRVDVDSENLKEGLLGLVMALVEIIRDALKLQAVRRMDSGRLTERQIEQLGDALIQLDQAIEDIKAEQKIESSVNAAREGLNEVVDEVLNPEHWASSAEKGSTDA
ncbi:MAG: gas vesicle protein K [Candidatus Bipolaricaulota bacterium]